LLILVILATLPVPPATLFPYTTLFRSSQVQRQPRADLPIVGEVEAPVWGHGIFAELVAHLRAARPAEQHIGQSVAGGSAAGRVVDRKSTRLNSSHDQISYAVFCLKKKI